MGYLIKISEKLLETKRCPFVLIMHIKIEDIPLLSVHNTKQQILKTNEAKSERER